MSNTDTQLRVTNLSVGYPNKGGAAPALCGVTFELGSSSLAIVGASAAGKSTLLHSIIGLLPPGARIGGRVHLPGAGELTALTSCRLREYRRQSLGVIWQDPVGSLIPGVPVDKQLWRAFTIRHAHLDQNRSRDSDRKAVEALLRRVGFNDPREVSGKSPAMLSGGMCQRCVIAMALAAPQLRLLVADEPTGSLDAVSAAQVLDLLFEIHRDRNATFLMVTHDVRLARRFDWIAVMDSGSIAEFRCTGEFFSEPHSPAGQALLRASRALGGDGELNRPTTKENMPC
jgi:ABC-type dipeptide/oligopeptide/nickel transport system ATPase component